MAWYVYDRICETSTTTGTGAMTLAGAVPGFQAFDDYLTVGSTVNYLIEAVDADGVATGEWETGVGTYSATNVLTRTTIRDGSQTTPVPFSAGTKRVHLAAIAMSLTPLAGRVKRTTTLSALNASAALTAITWETLVFETHYAFTDIGAAATRLTFPSVLTTSLVRITANLVVENVTSGTELEAQIHVNNSAAAGHGYTRVVASAANKATISIDSGLISAAPADYFEVMIKSADTSIDLTAFSWAQIEVFGQI